jgi:cellulose synthase/poly-beta-1,6-N-acetylglucosamine synthase-like glycosyltransferase
MPIFEEIILYFFLFVGIYFQVFVLFSYLVHRRRIQADTNHCFERETYPSATIIVPVWNEEKTVEKTIDSLLALNYPKDRLHITVVDDGSTDTTWDIIKAYKKRHKSIDIYHKENGGKYTALNYGIERATTDLVGCLDADSFVDKDTLKKLACRFDDPETMAVTPAMKVYNPTTVVQAIQSVDYIFGILIKKIMGFIGAIHVTPGPFTIFRRELFQKIGPFKHAHNTEDMEIAFRMQKNHMKIDNVHNAWVYTTGPNTFKKLYKQRLRWTYGFLQNSRDYKELFFNPSYGNIGLITLPTALILIIGTLFSVYFLLSRIAITLFNAYMRWKTVGFVHPHLHLSLFYVSTKTHILLIIFIYVLMVSLVLTAQKLADERVGLSRRMLYYFVLYPLISPFWIIKSMYNVVFSKKTSWR